MSARLLHEKEPESAWITVLVCQQKTKDLLRPPTPMTDEERAEVFRNARILEQEHGHA